MAKHEYRLHKFDVAYIDARGKRIDLGRIVAVNAESAEARAARLFDLDPETRFEITDAGELRDYRVRKESALCRKHSDLS